MRKQTAELVVDARRRLVTRLYLCEGLTLAETAVKAATIAAEDGQPVPGGLNPDTLNPWGLDTLSRDVAFLKRQWRESAAAQLDEHTAHLLAELKQVKIAAWERGRLNQIMMAIDREMKILGVGDRDDQLPDPLPDPLESVQYKSREEFEAAMQRQYARNMGPDRIKREPN